jgi:vacuolar protein sorting-associated protein 53
MFNAKDDRQSKQDPFCSETFDPIDFINALFPDASSIALRKHPHENDLEQDDETLNKLQRKLTETAEKIDCELRKHVRDRSFAGKRVVRDLEIAQECSKALGEKMQDLFERCERARDDSVEISRDVGRLDRAKRRLTKAITSLRRLSMFVSATSQLELMCQRRNYRDAAHLLEAVSQLSVHFGTYRDVPKIQRMREKYEEIANELRNAVFEDFATLWQPQTLQNDPNAFRTLSDACLVVDALEPRVREDVVGRLTSKELAEYAASFSNERNNVASVDRRCNWIAKRVREKSTAWAVFPERWAVARLFAASLCKMTRAFITEALDNKREMDRAKYGANDASALSQASSDDAQVLLMALRRTLEFEAELDETFGNSSSSSSSVIVPTTTDYSVSEERVNNEMSASAVRERAERERKQRDLNANNRGRMMPMDSAASAAMNITFRGAISGAFEGHLQSYVDLERRQMLDGIERGTKSETWGSADYEANESSGGHSSSLGAQDGNSLLAGRSNSSTAINASTSSSAKNINNNNNSKILISSGDMFMNIKKVFKRCANLARGQTLFEMFTAFQVVLETYAFKLNERAERAAAAIANPRNTEQMKLNEIKVLVLIVNTAEYCAETIAPLTESTRRALDPSFREKIDGSSSEDAYQSCIAKTLNTLVSSVTINAGISTEVLRVNWATIESVGDHSKFVETCARTFLNASKIVCANASSENHFRFFCEKLASSASRELRATLLRVKKFSMVGCQQALLDANAIKSQLLEIPSVASMDKSSNNIDNANARSSNFVRSFRRTVDREFTRIDAVLKCVLNPEESIAESLRHMDPKATRAEFMRICDARGMKKTDTARYVEQFDRLGSSSTEDVVDTTNPEGIAAGIELTHRNSNSNLKNLMQKMNADFITFVKKG